MARCDRFALPKGWTKTIRSSVLHAVSLVSAALTSAWDLGSWFVVLNDPSSYPPAAHAPTLSQLSQSFVGSTPQAFLPGAAGGGPPRN